MQTFLPYPDFQASALVLDRRRLGKQRVEGVQILEHLVFGRGAWMNHPAVRMWEGYEPWLGGYIAAMCGAWRALGYEDNMLERVLILLGTHFSEDTVPTPPPWWGEPRLHDSHKRALHCKDPVHYAIFEEFGEMPRAELVCCDGCNYWWPPHVEVKSG